MKKYIVEVQPTIKVINKLKRSMKNKTPFALIRWGDGALKLLHSYFYNDESQLLSISKKEGIPVNKIKQIIDLWAASANISDFIDSPCIYGTEVFWQRVRKNKTISVETKAKLDKWHILYELAGFNNNIYCNPEINFLLCLDKLGKNSLPELLKNKKICLITSRTDAYEALIEYDIDILQVASQGEYQYSNSFNTTLTKVKSKARKYDLFLVAAGELGRIYTGIIKYSGGRALDIGSLIDFWCIGCIPDRLRKFIRPTYMSRLKVELTDIGSQYKRFI